MYNDELLEIDINDMIKSKIKKEIEGYKYNIKKYEGKIRNYENEKIQLDKEIKCLQNKLCVNELIIKLQSTYSNFRTDSEKFKFIKCLMENIFNIHSEYNIACHDLATNLAIDYYHNKNILLDILKNIEIHNIDIIYSIENFRMPYDYNKDEVINFIINPIYTNFINNDNILFWTSTKSKNANIPCCLIMQNKYMLHDDVFELLLDRIKTKKHPYYHLFNLPFYNKDISKRQIELLGELSLYINDLIPNDTFYKFIQKFLCKFDEKTLDGLFHRIQFPKKSYLLDLFHWDIFPMSYQIKYLKSQNFETVYKILTDQSCKWNISEKQNFFKLYFNNL